MSMAFLYPWKKHPTAAAKAISSTSFSSENRYEGVSLSKKNCGEGFSGSSSIPVVDLDEKVAALDRRSSKPDDLDGFGNADVAVPYDQQLVNGGAEKIGMRVQPGYLSSSEKTKMSYKSSPLNVPHHQPNLNSNNKNSPPLFDDELDENSEAGVSAAALKKAIEHAQKIINIAKILMERKKKESLQDGYKSRVNDFSKVEDNKETMDENLGEILDKKCGEKTTKRALNNEVEYFEVIEKSQKLEKNDQQQRIEARERALEKDLDGTESAMRRKARLERHKRITERVANALAEKKSRDHLVQKEQDERNRLSKNLDAEIKRWATGKEGNLRALLSTLQYILGPESGWKAISLTEIITSAAVKKAYRKATLCLHPDKLQQRRANIRQKYICEKVFDLLRVAWNKFNSEEM